MIWNTCGVGGWTCFSLSDEMVEIVFIYVVHVANKLCLFFGEGKNVPINLFNAGELYPSNCKCFAFGRCDGFYHFGGLFEIVR